MEPEHLNPAGLPSETRIGPWRVLEPLGRGTYGVVYRAVQSEQDAADCVALKLALHPGDARFLREAELLSRLRHPAIPRLRGQGQWLSPTGACYAWLAMDLVEGPSIYDWALAQRPTARQVLRVLAQLARALEATHAAGGVHRDVKGENVRVRRADAQPFLLDFGAAHHLGAATLTWQPFPPGTPAYRSPEAWRYVLRSRKPPTVPYAPGPADDVFALGVTAFRLLTQKYPPPTHPEAEDARLWRPEQMQSWSPRACNARCGPELSALVSRMLAPRPQARGNARDLAEALEQAARRAGAEADVPLFTGDEPRPAGLMPPPQHVTAQPRRRVTRWPRLAAASLGGALALCVGGMLSVRALEAPTDAPRAKHEDAKDGGTVAVGDSALTAPVPLERTPFAGASIAVDVPPQPVPGQTRPNASGRCPRFQVSINGVCWKKLALGAKDCGEGDVVYQGACYTPAYPPVRPPTSSPAKRTDD